MKENKIKIADAIKSSIISRRGFKGNLAIDEIGLPVETDWTKKYFADVMEVTKDGKVLIYEVQSCIQDYKSDNKWENYLQFCDLFYFVSERHVIELIEKEVPSHVGLYIFEKGHLVCKRNARKHGDKIDSCIVKSSMEKTFCYRLAKIHSRKLKQFRDNAWNSNITNKHNTRVTK